MKFGIYETESRDIGLASGEAYIVTLPNGYDASIVRSEFSYGGKQGLWELAILRDGNIDYSTPITEDVLGWLTDTDVSDTLDKISALPSRGRQQ